MKIRFLPPEEWAKLEVPGVPDLLAYTEPQNVAIIVGEDDSGKVVGCLMALRVTHLEGLWVDPAYRGSNAAWRLYQQATALARLQGEHFVIGGAADVNPKMDDLIRRCGGKQMPLRFYSMPVGGH